MVYFLFTLALGAPAERCGGVLLTCAEGRAYVARAFFADPTPDSPWLRAFQELPGVARYVPRRFEDTGRGTLVRVVDPFDVAIPHLAVEPFDLGTDSAGRVWVHPGHPEEGRKKKLVVDAARPLQGEVSEASSFDGRFARADGHVLSLLPGDTVPVGDGVFVLRSKYAGLFLADETLATEWGMLHRLAPETGPGRAFPADSWPVGGYVVSEVDGGEGLVSNDGGLTGVLRRAVLHIRLEEGTTRRVESVEPGLWGKTTVTWTGPTPCDAASCHGFDLGFDDGTTGSLVVTEGLLPVRTTSPDGSVRFFRPVAEGGPLAGSGPTQALRADSGAATSSSGVYTPTQGTALQVGCAARSERSYW